MLKKCSQCRKHLSLDSFHKDKTKPDGYYTVCKGCRISKPPSDADGLIQCKICDQYKYPNEYYPAADGFQRKTCRDCSEQRWNKSYKRKTTTHPNEKKSLFGFLSRSAQRLLWHDGHKEQDRETDKKYRDSEKGKAKRAEWNDNHRDKLRLKVSKRRARLADVDDGFTIEDWNKTLETFGNKCVYCESRDTPTIDHWIPLARGGRHHIGNIVPACKSCNYKKKDKLPQNFCGKEIYQRIAGGLVRLQNESGHTSDGAE